MQIWENFICGKENNPATCEDGIFIGKSIVSVIDGVTAKGNKLWNGHKSGYYAKELLLEYMRQEEIEQQDVVTLLLNLDEVLHQYAVARNPDLPSEEYPRASIVIYNDCYKEIWSYGDCQCSINGTIHNHVKKIDEQNAALRAYYLEEHLKKGKTLEELVQNDPGRAAIQEKLLAQFAYENKPGALGYPVLNGMGIEPSMLRRYKVHEGDEIILASDGYPELGKDLAESEEKLKHILREDPMCFRLYKCTKGVKEGNVSFDDRAFCRFLVSDQ